MTSPQILAATLVAAFLYVVSPGPAFLALFTLAASRGRAAGAKFICGHLVGDVTWGALAVTAIVGANRIGPTLFELLGFGCGLYLVYLGGRAVMTRKDAPPRTIGPARPLATGMAFGLTNPKAYPVALGEGGPKGRMGCGKQVWIDARSQSGASRCPSRRRSSGRRRG
jgi:threonine efflux protein